MEQPVAGYENLYAVTDEGYVYSIRKGKYLNSAEKVKTEVTLYKNGKRKVHAVSQIVAAAYLERIPGKRYARHKDGNRTNNRPSNLEYCMRGEDRIKLTQKEIDTIVHERSCTATIKYLARENRTSPKTIKSILKKREDTRDERDS